MEMRSVSLIIVPLLRVLAQLFLYRHFSLWRLKVMTSFFPNKVVWNVHRRYPTMHLWVWISQIDVIFVLHKMQQTQNKYLIPKYHSSLVCMITSKPGIFCPVFYIWRQVCSVLLQEISCMIVIIVWEISKSAMQYWDWFAFNMTK